MRRAYVLPLADRFWAKVQRPDDPAACWLWTSGRTIGGYGQFRNTTAHRVAWELSHGPIADGLEIDHLCRNTLCVNPSHLEAVTPAENRKRAGLVVTHCPNGHPYDESNTYHRVDAQGWRHRSCKECNRQKCRDRYWKRQAS